MEKLSQRDQKNYCNKTTERYNKNMNEDTAEYMKTLEEQVKAQALLITKLQAELIVFQKRAAKYEAELNKFKLEEE